MDTQWQRADDPYDDLQSHDVPKQSSHDRDAEPIKIADAGDEIPERTAPAPDASHRRPDGGWEWKGLELDRAANEIADDALAARRTAEGRDENGGYTEHGITPAMRQIEAGLEHGSLIPDTEKFALKGPDRFKEKLAKMILDEPDRSPTDLASSVHDGIRYTFLFDEIGYCDGVRAVHDALEKAGYEDLVLKNTWNNDEYKGINTRWQNPEGVLFEVQFHTVASWEAKQLSHEAYEKIADPQTTAIERERLRAFQTEVSSRVDVPGGVYDIAEHRREGW